MSEMLHHKSWITISEELKSLDAVILPLGSMEAHGAHKPVGCCYLLAEAASRVVSERTGVPTTPVVPFGVSLPYNHFPGTITVTMETLGKYVYEASTSLARAGFRKFMFFSAHGGNNLPVLREISFRLREEYGALCTVVHIWGLISRLTPDGFWEKGQRLGHGGEPTTSVMLYLHPDLIDMSKAELKPLMQHLEGFETRSYGVHWFEGVPHSVYLFGEEVEPSGFMGDPTKSSAEKGKILYERAVKHLVRFVEAFKKLDPRLCS